MTRDDNNLYYDSIESENSGVNTKPDTRSATPSEVVKDYGYINPRDGEILFGAMEEVKSSNYTIEPGETIKLPAGYYPNGVTIKATSLEDYTYGTAKDTDIDANKIAWINGKRVVGKGKIFNPKIETTATAEDILERKTAYDYNKTFLTGTIKNIGNFTSDIVSSAYGEGNNLHSKTIKLPGALSGNYNEISVTIPELNNTTATPEDILKGKVAIANNNEVTGTLDIVKKFGETVSSQISAHPEDILAGKATLVSDDNGYRIGNGTMQNSTNINPVYVSNVDKVYAIPKGYHDGTGKVNFQLVKTLPGNFLSEATNSSVLNGRYFFKQNGDCEKGGVILASWAPRFLNKYVDGYVFNGANEKIDLHFNDDPTANRIISFVNRGDQDLLKEFVPIYSNMNEADGDFANTVLAIPTPLRQFSHINHYNTNYKQSSLSSLQDTQFTAYMPMSGGYFEHNKYSINDDYYSPWFSNNIMEQGKNIVIDKITVKFYNNRNKSQDSLIYKITFPYIPLTESQNITEYYSKCINACNVDYDGIDYGNRETYDNSKIKLYAICGLPTRSTESPGNGITFFGGNFPITFHIHTAANGNFTERTDMKTTAPKTSQLWDSNNKTYIDIEFHDIHILNKSY